MIIYYNIAVIIKTIPVPYGMGILYRKGERKELFQNWEKQS